ncbi:type II toxin-antitoxin system HigB family toxin [Halomicronema sp. CCY15110]|uniref:type II toxin-antitoxin system HigB family toxin n=1 Tax=Halomicronema sp. CCY15110 TaxID=2767773 RepID=UPI0019514B6C|nr:type II toxin-antitoxin system HigB family toxin [Halomicronema sp. CCY15110]
MHVITKLRLTKFWQRHPQAQVGLSLWYKLTTSAKWQDLAEVRKTFGSADQVANFTVFNIGGNKYRLITFIDYTYQKVFIRDILTHAEYDQEKWKQNSWYQ